MVMLLNTIHVAIMNRVLCYMFELLQSSGNLVLLMLTSWTLVITREMLGGTRGCFWPAAHQDEQLG